MESVLRWLRLYMLVILLLFIFTALWQLGLSSSAPQESVFSEAIRCTATYDTMLVLDRRTDMLVKFNEIGTSINISSGKSSSCEPRRLIIARVRIGLVSSCVLL